MKIMLVVNEFPPEKIAGTAMATKALAEYLNTSGHQVCVLVTTACPKDKLKDIQPHDYILKWLTPRPFRGLGWLWRMYQTWKHAKAFSPDVMQGQAVSCGLIVGVVGRLLGVPSLCYAQGYDVYQASWWQRKTEIRWGCSLPDVCLAVSQQLKQHIERIANVPVQLMPHAFILPTLIQTREETRRKYHISAQSKLVFNVARLEYFKGHDVLLQACKECLQTVPNIHLLIAGTGSLQAELEAMTADLGIADHVCFLGYLSQQEVHHIMQAADLFVLPSRSEPFGIVLLEAMAHGLPVVASRVDGIPEVLSEDDDVQMVAAEDVQALTSAMQASFCVPAFPSKKNQQHARPFTWQQQLIRFESVYAAILK